MLTPAQDRSVKQKSSSITSPPSVSVKHTKRRYAKLTVWKIIFYASIIFITWLAIRKPEEMPRIVYFFEDYIQHSLAFLYLALIMTRAYPSVSRKVIWVFLISYGTFIEVLQFFVPFRDASITDIMADVFGLIMFEAMVRIKRIVSGIYCSPLE